MDYLITNLIDEIIWQLQGFSFWEMLITTYIGVSIAQYAGKYAALRENDKALKSIANAFYVGARCGIACTWRFRQRSDLLFLQEAIHRLDVARRTKRSAWL